MQDFSSDERGGVKKLVLQYGKKADRYEKELIRLEKMRAYEKKYQEAEYICGIDEVGRGPLAGPVVTCAVILPKDFKNELLNDSKQLSEKQRYALREVIEKEAILMIPKNFPKKRERSLHRS